MKNRFRDAAEAKNWLASRNIEVGNKVVRKPAPQFSGLRVWGAIDYLINHCGFTLAAEL